MSFHRRAVRIPFSRLFKWAVLARLTGGRSRPKPVPAERIRHSASKMLDTPSPSLTWCGHASVIVRMNGSTILTDPNWHRALVIPRMVAAAPRLSQLPPIDAVTVSHNHYDHLSIPTLRRLAAQRPQPLGIVPLGNGKFLRKAGFRDIVELDWWDSTRVGEVDVTMVPARHWSRRTPFDLNRALWGGFVFLGERRVYFSGDTALWDGFDEIATRLGPFDAAALPIGAYQPEWFMRHQHMSPEDAGEAFLRSGARMLMAIHWGTFILADEPTNEPPRRLEAWWKSAATEGKTIWIPKIGETAPI